MEQNSMTIKEVLNVTVRILSDINVRVSEMDTTGSQIKNAISNLNLCIEAINNHEGEYANGPDTEIK